MDTIGFGLSSASLFTLFISLYLLRARYVVVSRRRGFEG